MVEFFSAAIEFSVWRYRSCWKEKKEKKMNQIFRRKRDRERERGGRKKEKQKERR